MLNGAILNMIPINLARREFGAFMKGLHDRKRHSALDFHSALLRLLMKEKRDLISSKIDTYLHQIPHQ